MVEEAATQEHARPRLPQQAPLSQPTPPDQSVLIDQAVTKRRRRGCGCLLRTLLLTLFSVGALAVLIGTVAGTLVYAELEGEIEAGIDALENARTRETFETTRIYDRNGELLWEIFGEGKRTYVELDDIPANLQAATIAVEDDTFYTNIGLDAPSLVAALIANVRNPGNRPVGGSTITQQLVRHLAFDYEERVTVSYERKTKEIILAWVMTRQYTKEEILTLYLNEIYYGNLAYGVEAASNTYFGKSAAELNLAEASLLAALPQNPVELDPFTNLDGAKERQWIVLSLMVGDGIITLDEAEAAYQTPLTFAAQEVSLEAPHFAVWVRQQLEAEYGAELVANGGLRVTTSLDLRYQALAEFLARQHVDQLDPSHNLTNTSLVAMKPGTGEILAMLGSVDYRDETIDGHVNIALSAQQPGSAIKPLTFAAALATQNDDGSAAWTAADILWDVEVEYPQLSGATYAPVNYDERFHGPVRLRDALANSYNIPAILLLQDIGIDTFLPFAREMGLNSLSDNPSQYGLALTLGGAEVTPLELTSSYAVLANGGYRIPPAAILRVEKSDGEVLFAYEQPEPTQVLDERVAYLISDILDDDAARVPAMGRDNPLTLPFPAAAKTGTSNDFRDNWTVGYTPGLVVGVWAGNADNSEMVDISGLTGAAPLWSDYVQAVYASYDLQAVLASDGAQPPTEFVAPAGLTSRPLCNLDAITPGATVCEPAGSELFLTDANVDEPSDPAFLTWEQPEPAVVSVPAMLLPPLPADIQISNSAADVLPPQTSCHFAAGTEIAFLPPEAAPQLYLTPPRNPESMQAAYAWAAANEQAILPHTPCDDALIAAARNGKVPAVWRITSPASGDTVSGILPIVGVASFDAEYVRFYKIELGRGDLNNPEWVTLGETRANPVPNGELETLYASGLPAGEYLLRLILVGHDGNYVGEPHTIQITVSAE